MLILVSGEGATDIGVCVTPVQQPCGNPDFRPGPMAWFIDQIAEAIMGYPFIESGCLRFISESTLSKRAKGLRTPALAGSKRPKETAYFFRNARALAQVAQALAEATKDDVVAVLFRDADGTQSAGRGLWQAKWSSMQRGFDTEGFASGVPMIPKPKSEAWLLCALKDNQPYQHCGAIEDESGNDRSPNSLKNQLDQALGEAATSTILVDKVRDREVDVFQINDMPSFSTFKSHLEDVLRGGSAVGGYGG